MRWQQAARLSRISSMGCEAAASEDGCERSRPPRFAAPNRDQQHTCEGSER
jgi:hypothetical protein